MDSSYSGAGLVFVKFLRKGASFGSPWLNLAAQEQRNCGEYRLSCLLLRRTGQIL